MCHYDYKNVERFLWHSYHLMIDVLVWCQNLFSSISTSTATPFNPLSKNVYQKRQKKCYNYPSIISLGLTLFNWFNQLRKIICLTISSRDFKHGSIC